MAGLTVQRFWPVLALAAAAGGCSGSSLFSSSKTADAPAVEANVFPKNYRTEITEFMRTYVSNPVKIKEIAFGISIATAMVRMNRQPMAT